MKMPIPEQGVPRFEMWVVGLDGEWKRNRSFGQSDYDHQLDFMNNRMHSRSYIYDRYLGGVVAISPNAKRELGRDS